MKMENEEKSTLAVSGGLPGKSPVDGQAEFPLGNHFITA